MKSKCNCTYDPSYGDTEFCQACEGKGKEIKDICSCGCGAAIYGDEPCSECAYRYKPCHWLTDDLVKECREGMWGIGDLIEEVIERQRK